MSIEPDARPAAAPTVAILCTLLASGVPRAIGQTVAIEPAAAPTSGAMLHPNLPFSAAVRAGAILYLSGQIGVRPGTLELVPGGIRAEAHQALENIRSVLAEHRLGMDSIVKCTVMLADIDDWPAFNEVYRTFFEAAYPARSAFAASGLGLGASVEIDCIATFAEKETE